MLCVPYMHIRIFFMVSICVGSLINLAEIETNMHYVVYTQSPLSIYAYHAKHNNIDNTSRIELILQ